MRTPKTTRIEEIKTQQRELEVELLTLEHSRKIAQYERDARVQSSKLESDILHLKREVAELARLKSEQIKGREETFLVREKHIALFVALVAGREFADISKVLGIPESSFKVIYLNMIAGMVRLYGKEFMTETDIYNELFNDGMQAITKAFLSHEMKAKLGFIY